MFLADACFCFVFFFFHFSCHEMMSCLFHSASFSPAHSRRVYTGSVFASLWISLLCAWHLVLSIKSWILNECTMCSCSFYLNVSAAIAALHVSPPIFFHFIYLFLSFYSAFLAVYGVCSYQFLLFKKLYFAFTVTLFYQSVWREPRKQQHFIIIYKHNVFMEFHVHSPFDQLRFCGMLLFTDFNSTSVILGVFHIQTADEHQNICGILELVENWNSQQN